MSVNIDFIRVEKIRRKMTQIAEQIERERKRKKKKIRDKQRKQVTIRDVEISVPLHTADNFKVKVDFKPVKFKSGKIFGGVSGTSKRGFSKVKVYKKEQLKHALHLLRLDTERQGLAPRPALMFSSEGHSEEEIYEKILKMHDDDNRKGTKGGRKSTNAYVEICAAFESIDLLKNYVNDLSQRFNTEVFAVIHRDENVEHAHILLSYKDKNGKSLRLYKFNDKNNKRHATDFWKLHKETIRKLQPSREWRFRKGDGFKKFKFHKYHDAWKRGEDEYKSFVDYTRYIRELFYEFEDENPLLSGYWKRKFFNDWLAERNAIDRVVRKLNSIGVVSVNERDTNDSLYHFTSLTDTTHDTETPNDEIPNDKLNSQDAAAPLHPEDRNKTDLDVDTDIDLAVDDPTTIQKETLGDRLEKEKDIFDEIEEIFRKEETMKETSLLEQQERERMERERMEKEEIERKKNSQNVEEVFVGVIKDILNTTQKTLQKGLRVGKDIAVDTNEIDKMLGLNEQEHPAETKEKKDTVFKRPEQSRSVFSGKRR